MNTLLKYCHRIPPLSFLPCSLKAHGSGHGTNEHLLELVSAISKMLDRCPWRFIPDNRWGLVFFLRGGCELPKATRQVLEIRDGWRSCREGKPQHMHSCLAPKDTSRCHPRLRSSLSLSTFPKIRKSLLTQMKSFVFPPIWLGSSRLVSLSMNLFNDVRGVS